PVVAAAEDPGEDGVPGLHAPGACDLCDAVHEREVSLEVLLGEARVLPPEVAIGDLLARPEPAGEEATTEGAVRNEADPELSTGRQHLGLRVAGPERVLGLNSGDRVHRVRAADRLGRCLRQPDVADLAGR